MQRTKNKRLTAKRGAIEQSERPRQPRAWAEEQNTTGQWWQYRDRFRAFHRFAHFGDGPAEKGSNDTPKFGVSSGKGGS